MKEWMLGIVFSITYTHWLTALSKPSEYAQLLTSLSIGVVVADVGRFHNILEIGEIGAQVKHAAKSVMGSSYAIDKRRL